MDKPKQQKSVDRDRDQSLNIMSRCAADLRQLQTTREIRTEMKCAPNIFVLTDIQTGPHYEIYRSRQPPVHNQ
jgi:hypothetical protein